MIDKEIPTGEEVKDDLTRFTEKINALFLESCEGKSPQILKICLMKKVIDIYENEYKRRFGEDIFKEGNRIIDVFVGGIIRVGVMEFDMNNKDDVKKLRERLGY